MSDLFIGAVERGVAEGVLQPAERPDQVAGQLQGMIEHGTLMRGLILGDDVETLLGAEAIADDALATWLSR